MIPPEVVHRLAIRLIGSSIGRKLVGLNARDQIPCLPTTLPRSGLNLPNPLGVAAGFDKNAQIASALLNAGFGFAECGTVTPLPQPGNPKPRLFRLRNDKALINRMGFNSRGLTPFVERLKQMPDDLIGRIGVNIGANRDSADRISDYAASITELAPLAGYLTLNISSPNTPGLRELQNENAFDELLGTVGETLDQLPENKPPPPLFIKIAADLRPADLGKLVERSISDRHVSGLIISNTLLSERPENLLSRHAHQKGGLSGAPIFDKTTDALKDAARMCSDKLDLIGAGGIHDANTAYAKLRSGAQAIQVYTGFVYHGAPLIDSILDGLSEMLRADGVTSIEQIVGADL